MKKVLLLLFTIMLTLTGCTKYPGDYVDFIYDFGPDGTECNSFYHYIRVGDGLHQSGLQRYDLISGMEQDIFMSSDPHNEEVTSYYGNDVVVYYVVNTSIGRDKSENILYQYDLKTDTIEKMIVTEGYLSVVKDAITGKIKVFESKQNYFIENGVLQEIDASDENKSKFSSDEDIVSRINDEGLLVQICKKDGESEYTYKCNGTIGVIDALSDFRCKESGLTNFFVIDGDTIIGIVQITEGIRGLPPINYIRSGQLKKELLVSLNYKTGESEILYNTKNNSTRIIGFGNGNIYLLKKGKIICRTISDGSEKEIYTLSYDGDNQLYFSWCGSKLVIFDRDDQEVIANIQT
jgi:hypothetical protein